MTDETLSLLIRFERLARLVAAYAVFTLLLSLMLANWTVPYFQVLKPQLLLIFVFYWSIYRPTLLPVPIVFLAGLVVDLLVPTLPLGTSAASLILIAIQTRRRRRALLGLPFFVVWALFAVAVLADSLMRSLAVFLLTPHEVSFILVAINGIVTLLVFPLIGALLGAIHRLLPGGGRGLIVR